MVKILIKNHIKFSYILSIALINVSVSSSTLSHVFEQEQSTKPINVNEGKKQSLYKKKKAFTIIIYMAADNDLALFARKNLKQLIDIGSNYRINIVVQLDTRVAGNKKITKRYYVEKGKLLITNHQDPYSQQMDSGSPQTLFECCKWGISNFPADDYILVLWNHGTGAIDIGGRRSINPSPLFLYNYQQNKFELDRNINFFDYVQTIALQDLRGICFDDSTGHYLSNQDLDQALYKVYTELLHTKKFSLICFDACLMSMIEIASIVKKYADYMTASQEVELGTGYDYRRAMLLFQETTPLNSKDIAQHIVESYKQTYNFITNDYTHSALDLSQISFLENNIHLVSKLLIECLKQQKGTTVRDALRASRHKLFCTQFDVTSYVDLFNLYANIRENLKHFKLETNQNSLLIASLNDALQDGLFLIKKTVIANVSGKNLKGAHGISIYFPEKTIHGSYQKTIFAQTNKWREFLLAYLRS